MLSHVWLFETHGLYSPWNCPGQNTGVGSLSLLQGIFPFQGLSPGLLLCRQILYQMNHKGSPRILESVAYPFLSASSWPRNLTRVSCIAGRFFTNWAISKFQHDCNGFSSSWVKFSEVEFTKFFWKFMKTILEISPKSKKL